MKKNLDLLVVTALGVVLTLTSSVITGCQPYTDPATGKTSQILTPQARQAADNALVVLQAAVLGAANSAAANLQNQAVNRQLADVDTASLSGAAIFGGLSSAALQLRSLQSTPQAAAPAAVKAAIADAGNAPLAAQIAPVVASQIQIAVKQGASPDDANEVAAMALDKAAAQ